MTKMLRKSNNTKNSLDNKEGKSSKTARKKSGKKKQKNSKGKLSKANSWPYQDTLRVLPESLKLDRNSLSNLEFRTQYQISVLAVYYTHL